MSEPQRLRQVNGVAAVSAAEFIGEVAGADRFRSCHALPGTTGTRPRRSVSQPRTTPTPPRRQPTTQRRNPPGRADRRLRKSRRPGIPRPQAGSRGHPGNEAVCSLRHRISDTIYRDTLADAQKAQQAHNQAPLDIGQREPDMLWAVKRVGHLHVGGWSRRHGAHSWCSKRVPHSSLSPNLRRQENERWT